MSVAFELKRAEDGYSRMRRGVWWRDVLVSAI